MSVLLWLLSWFSPDTLPADSTMLSDTSWVLGSYAWQRMPRVTLEYVGVDSIYCQVESGNWYHAMSWIDIALLSQDSVVVQTIPFERWEIVIRNYPWAVRYTQHKEPNHE